MKAKFAEEDQICGSEAASAALATIPPNPEEGSGPNWRPEKEFDPQVALKVFNARNALSGAGSDGLRLLHLQSKIRTGFERENLGAGIEASGEKISMIQTSSHLISCSSSCNPSSPQNHRPVSVGDDVKASYCGRDHAAVATTAGGVQTRSETAWNLRMRGGGTGSAMRKDTSRDKNLADSHRLIQRTQHSEVGGCDCGGSHLHTGAYIHRS